MATGSVSVPMSQFFLGCRTYFNDLYRKFKSFSCEFMVEINGYQIIGNGSYGEGTDVRHQHHTDLRINVSKLIPLNLLNGIFHTRPISALWFEGEGAAFANFCSHHFIFESRYHLFVTNEECKGVSSLARVKDFTTFRKFSCIVDAGYGVFC